MPTKLLCMRARACVRPLVSPPGLTKLRARSLRLALEAGLTVRGLCMRRRCVGGGSLGGYLPPAVGLVQLAAAAAPGCSWAGAPVVDTLQAGGAGGALFS